MGRSAWWPWLLAGWLQLVLTMTTPAADLLVRNAHALLTDRWWSVGTGIAATATPVVDLPFPTAASITSVRATSCDGAIQATLPLIAPISAGETVVLVGWGRAPARAGSFRFGLRERRPPWKVVMPLQTVSLTTGWSTFQITGTASSALRQGDGEAVWDLSGPAQTIEFGALRLLSRGSAKPVRAEPAPSLHRRESPRTAGPVDVIGSGWANDIRIAGASARTVFEPISVSEQSFTAAVRILPPLPEDHWLDVRIEIPNQGPMLTGDLLLVELHGRMMAGSASSATSATIVLELGNRGGEPTSFRTTWELGPHWSSLHFAGWAFADAKPGNALLRIGLGHTLAGIEIAEVRIINYGGRYLADVAVVPMKYPEEIDHAP